MRLGDTVGDVVGHHGLGVVDGEGHARPQRLALVVDAVAVEVVVGLQADARLGACFRGPQRRRWGRDRGRAAGGRGRRRHAGDEQHVAGVDDVALGQVVERQQLGQRQPGPRGDDPQRFARRDDDGDGPALVRRGRNPRRRRRERRRHRLDGRRGDGHRRRVGLGGGRGPGGQQRAHDQTHRQPSRSLHAKSLLAVTRPASGQTRPRPRRSTAAAGRWPGRRDRSRCGPAPAGTAAATRVYVARRS